VVGRTGKAAAVIYYYCSTGIAKLSSAQYIAPTALQIVLRSEIFDLALDMFAGLAEAPDRSKDVWAGQKNRISEEASFFNEKKEMAARDCYEFEKNFFALIFARYPDLSFLLFGLEVALVQHSVYEDHQKRVAASSLDMEQSQLLD